MMEKLFINIQNFNYTIEYYCFIFSSTIFANKC
jgi:hypothetical protein